MKKSEPPLKHVAIPHNDAICYVPHYKTRLSIHTCKFHSHYNGTAA